MVIISLPSGGSAAHLHSGDFIRIPPGGVNVSVAGSVSAVSMKYWEAWV
jgi:hypothetical protein